MRPAVKSEFRKLLSVRSTYLITLVIIALSCLFTYIGTGPEFVNQPQNQPSGSRSSAQSKTQPPPPQKTNNLKSDKLAQNIMDSSGAAVFIAVVVILLMAHEFRYNTISYTLTASNSRAKVLVAKLITATSYALFGILLSVAITIATTYLAVSIRGLNLPTQDIDLLSVGGRLIGYTLGFSLLGLAIITLVRNITAAIVSLFALPILDSLLGALLTKNNIEPIKYLPFSALNRLISTGGDGATSTIPSALHAGAVFSIYLIAAWLVAWYLFLRRDAS